MTQNDIIIHTDLLLVGTDNNGTWDSVVQNNTLENNAENSNAPTRTLSIDFSFSQAENSQALVNSLGIIMSPNENGRLSATANIEQLFAYLFANNIDPRNLNINVSGFANIDPDINQQIAEAIRETISQDQRNFTASQAAAKIASAFYITNDVLRFNWQDADNDIATDLEIENQQSTIFRTNEYIEKEKIEHGNNYQTTSVEPQTQEAQDKDIEQSDQQNTVTAYASTNNLVDSSFKTQKEGDLTTNDVNNAYSENNYPDNTTTPEQLANQAIIQQVIQQQAVEPNNAPVVMDLDLTLSNTDYYSIIYKSTLLELGSDLDDDQLSLTAIGSVNHGTLVDAGDHLIYTPDSGYNGPDVFSFTLSDGQTTTTANVNLQIFSATPQIVNGSGVIDLSATSSYNIINMDDGLLENIISGGSSVDIFAWNVQSNSYMPADIVTNFSQEQYDKIELDFPDRFTLYDNPLGFGAFSFGRENAISWYRDGANTIVGMSYDGIDADWQITLTDFNANNLSYNDFCLQQGIGTIANDTLNASTQYASTLTGGLGSDSFSWYALPLQTTSTITDFNKGGGFYDAGEGDLIKLSLNQQITLLETSPFNNTPNAINWQQSGDDTLISIDTNGDNISDFNINIANYLANNLHSSDFVFKNVLGTSDDDVFTVINDGINKTIDGNDGNDLVNIIGDSNDHQVIYDYGDILLSSLSTNEIDRYSNIESFHFQDNVTMQPSAGTWLDTISINTNTENTSLIIDPDLGHINSWLIIADGQTFGTITADHNGNIVNNELSFAERSSGQITLNNQQTIDFNNLQSLNTVNMNPLN